MSLGSIVVWISIYLITFTIFGAAAFGYFAGWWDDACLVAIALMTLVGFLAGRLTKTDYLIRKFSLSVERFNKEGLRDPGASHKAKQKSSAADKSPFGNAWDLSDCVSTADFCHDEKYLRRVKNALYRLSEVDRQGCQCWKCGSVNRGLKRFPHDPEFHRSGCPIPGARLLVAPIEIADDVTVIK